MSLKIAVLIISLASVGLNIPPNSALVLKASVPTRDWWESANYYQIYPRSFKDSDGNGVGDLKGIKEKAQYLKDLGMDGVWLSPILLSPMADFGYDIADYRVIDPLFGTMQDFEALLAEFKRVGLYLILDFVPNHTSDEAEWFKKSVAREPGYENFYVWRDGKPNPDGGRPLVPNNWVSAFRFSAWEWNEERQQYYYHKFHKKQPDLNYRDENLVREMKDVLRFWLGKGVSGFRIDVMNHLFEYIDENGDFPDEPLSGWCDDPESPCYTTLKYETDQPETYEMCYSWRAVLEEFKDPTRIMMTESYTSLYNIMRFFGDGTKNGSYIPFNFEFLTNLNPQSTAKDIKEIAERYMSALPTGKIGNWVLGNHDQKRLASRLGESRIDLYNILIQTLPGNAITYNGEELGMTDVVVSWADTKDPQACNTNSTVYHEYSRDPARTPFQWDDTANAGFSTAATTWLPVGPNYKTVNLKAQEKDPNSHYNLFKKLVQLHKSNAFRFGEYRSALLENNVYAFRRRFEDENFVIVLNFGKEDYNINLQMNFPSLGETIKVNVSTPNSQMSAGTLLKASSLKIPAESGFVAQVAGCSGLMISTVGVVLSIIVNLRGVIY